MADREKISGLIEFFRNQKEYYEDSIKHSNEQNKFYIYLFSFIITVMFSVSYAANLASIRLLLAIFAVILVLIIMTAVMYDNKLNKKMRERKIFFEVQISLLLFIKNSGKSFKDSKEMAKFILDKYPEHKFSFDNQEAYQRYYMDYTSKILDE